MLLDMQISFNRWHRTHFTLLCSCHKCWNIHKLSLRDLTRPINYEDAQQIISQKVSVYLFDSQLVLVSVSLGVVIYTFNRIGNLICLPMAFWFATTNYKPLSLVLISNVYCIQKYIRHIYQKIYLKFSTLLDLWFLNSPVWQTVTPFLIWPSQPHQASGCGAWCEEEVCCCIQCPEYTVYCPEYTV